MRKTTLLLILAVTVLYNRNASAQTDSSAASNLNLGKVVLKKEFTQSITIKGEDLEKMPFANLDDAVRARLYGAYSNSNTLLYVIDGIIVNDINSYSAYDIKEITLVQNALVQVSGSNGQQQILLVSTRQGGPGKKGLTIGGQSFLVKQDVPTGESSESNFYHQYHLSAYSNGDHIQYGASLNYLRDVSPGTKGSYLKVNTPANFDRFRLNAWLTAKLNEKHTFYVRMNTTPQFNDADYTIVAGVDLLTYKANAKQWTYNPTIGLRSTFSKGFTNDLSAGYLHGHNKLYYDQFNSTANPGNPDMTNYQHAETILKTQQVIVNDRIHYTTSIHDWQLEPAVDFMFRYTKKTSNYASAIYTNNVPTGMNVTKTWEENRFFSITPSVTLSYKQLFNLQGGLLANLATYKWPGATNHKLFPFITGTYNVLPPAVNQRGISLQVFGSYAQTPYAGDNPYNLASTSYTPGYIVLPYYSPSPQLNYNYRNEHAWTWQAGTRVGFFNDHLTFNYNFDRRLFKGQVIIAIPSGYNVLTPEIHTTGHFVSVNAHIVDKATVKWSSGITAAAIKNKTSPSITGYQYQTATGDFNNNTTSWTGGWVNKLNYEKLSVGLDLVYYFTKDAYPGINTQDKINALAVQNVYIGYQLKVGSKALEVYADSRNLIQDKDYKFNAIENNQYYGLGFKLSM